MKNFQDIPRMYIINKLINIRIETQEKIVRFVLFTKYKIKSMVL